MSQLFAPPPSPPAKPAGGRRRRLLPLFFQDPENRSVEIGIACTILVHLLLLLLVPRFLASPPAHGGAPRPRPIRQYNIELAPPPPPKPPPVPNKFVEANPNSNNNVPDRTTNFAAQNQQVAQEKPNPKGKSDMPTLDGRKDVHSTQIVSGSLAKPVQSVPVAPPSPVTPPKPTQVAPRQQQNPLSGFEKKEGDDKDGFGSNVSPQPDNAKDIPQKIDGAQSNAQADSSSLIPQIDPRHPQPRPTLEQQHVRPAIFAENKVGTSNMGVIGLDARWSSYGEYLQRMIETVQREWDNILGGRTYPPSGTTVTVKFRMTSDGKIAEIVDVNSTSTEQGKQACESAITNPSPYGKWTDEMIAVLGSQQEMTFVFYYQ
jgi:hypothetical protein